MKVEYSDQATAAGFALAWQAAGQAAPVPIPAEALFHDADVAARTPWGPAVPSAGHGVWAEYFEGSRHDKLVATQVGTAD